MNTNERPHHLSTSLFLRFLSGTVLLAALGFSTSAVASCVNHGGKGGCFASIVAAVAAASPGETIRVSPGVYKEDVVIWKSLSLIGAGSDDTIIDATGLANGIYVDGLDHPGLMNVVAAGFTIENANFEGVLITNAAHVTIKGNHVVANDKSLSLATSTCIGQPGFETDEGEDCGEGIHLSGAAYSTVADNLVENNSGGILLSDDTGKTNDNFIWRNTVRNNPYDCGITMASHSPAPGSRAAHFGIVRNIIADNTSAHNGFQVPGAGAGVGIFSDGSGLGTVSGNLVIRNEIINNGLPGVVFHSHVGPNFGLPADDLNGNLILGNYIAGNGPDLFDTPTPGPAGININSGGGGTPITGTVILGNVIERETDDVVINTPAEVGLHFNDLLGEKIGVANVGKGTVNATENWWGCSAGPGATGCSSVSGTGVISIPFLPAPLP